MAFTVVFITAAAWETMIPPNLHFERFFPNMSLLRFTYSLGTVGKPETNKKPQDDNLGIQREKITLGK